MGMSERFACRVVGQHRSTQHYIPVSDTTDDPDRGLREWLRDYARQHPRWGYRRAYHNARADGWVLTTRRFSGCGARKAYACVCRGAASGWGLRLIHRCQAAETPNIVWAIDFQYDATSDGRPISSRAASVKPSEGKHWASHSAVFASITPRKHAQGNGSLHND